MCGICGIASTSPRNLSRDAIAKMRGAIAHRGPDDSGEYYADHVAFGFQRLSIIDLTPTGHQPMSNDRQTVWVVFNGEIYNFQQLRSILQARGHTFRSTSDTEVIIRAYEEYGESFVEKLNGMFAIALWNTETKTLLLARDRLGKKPLFYTTVRGALYFASELQALRAVLPRPDIDTQALIYYLRFQCIPSPRTIFESVAKLSPGHVLVWRNGQVSLRRYWSYPRQATATLSLDEAGQELEKRLREAVRLRLVSDVPLGIFLSGGLDSSILTALMAEYLSEPVKTFSIGFSDQSHNELPLARKVAQRYGTQHHEFILDPNVVEILPKLLRHYGEPFADSSAVATYCVAGETRKHVTVALTGDGGDENFAGYDKYSTLSLLAKGDWLPLSVRTLAGRSMGTLARLMPHAWKNKFLVGSSLISGDLVSRYADLFFFFSQHEITAVCKPIEQSWPLTPDDLLRDRLSATNAETLIQKVTALDLLFYLPECLMTKADIATMANSLEARAPFLDDELLSFTISLPDRYKVSGSVRKFLLRRQLGHLVPSELLSQPKHGFDLPINHWLRTSLRQYAVDRLSSVSFRSLPYFDHRVIERLLVEHAGGLAHHGSKLWALLCFATWHDEVYE